MNDDMLNDLKQFIVATVTQQTTDIRDEMRQGFRQVEQKIDDLSASVAQALDTSNEDTAKQLDDHEARITQLEAKTA